MEPLHKRRRLTPPADPDLDLEDDFDFEEAQAQNDKKAWNRFQEIFKKYEHPFEGIGDEIDLVTGEIVVDNGHLYGMEDETDVGPIHSKRERKKADERRSRFVRALTLEPELVVIESSDEDEDDEEDEDDDDDDGEGEQIQDPEDQDDEDDVLKCEACWDADRDVCPHIPQPPEVSKPAIPKPKTPKSKVKIEPFSPMSLNHSRLHQFKATLDRLKSSTIDTPVYALDEVEDKGPQPIRRPKKQHIRPRSSSTQQDSKHSPAMSNIENKAKGQKEGSLGKAPRGKRGPYRKKKPFLEAPTHFVWIDETYQASILGDEKYPFSSKVCDPRNEVHNFARKMRQSMIQRNKNTPVKPLSAHLNSFQLRSKPPPPIGPAMVFVKNQKGNYIAVAPTSKSSRPNYMKRSSTEPIDEQVKQPATVALQKSQPLRRSMTPVRRASLSSTSTRLSVEPTATPKHAINSSTSYPTPEELENEDELSIIEPSASASILSRRSKTVDRTLRSSPSRAKTSSPLSNAAYGKAFSPVLTTPQRKARLELRNRSARTEPNDNDDGI
jgi:hypothetical protein